jgi:hypothetical protein
MLLRRGELLTTLVSEVNVLSLVSWPLPHLHSVNNDAAGGEVDACCKSRRAYESPESASSKRMFNDRPSARPPTIHNHKLNDRFHSAPFSETAPDNS